MNYPLSIQDTTFIIDNFYTQPDMIREHAIKEEKEANSAGQYAGVMTDRSFITQEHFDIIGRLVGHPVESSTQLCGKFRFTKEGDTYKQDIHFDPSDGGVWAGVCYLTPNVHKEGTIFWRHKKTGLESIPLTQQGIQQHGWYNVDDLKKFLETDGLDHSKWDQTLVLPFKYNRMVLFRPWLFHSPGPAFGDSYENCRLIQTFFFRVKR